MSNDITLPQLVINKMTPEQFEEAKAGGTISPTEMYFVDDAENGANLPEGGGGGGTAETWAETQLAKGVLAAGTPANTFSETGVTIGDLRRYKRFAIVVDGESNVGTGNLLFQFNGAASFQNTIYRSDVAGGKAMYEWLDNERTLLRLVAFYGGNPSTIIFGENIIKSAYLNFGTGSVLGGGAAEIVGTSSLGDERGLYVFNFSATSIAYNWEVRGLTI